MRQPSSRFLNIISVFLALGSAAQAADNTVEVKLFGQPCQLVGPLSRGELSLIHSISPEQLPALQTLRPAQETVEKLKNAQALPKELEMYRNQTLEHAKAWEAYFKGLSVTRKKKNTKEWISLVSPFLSTVDLAAFKTKTDAYKADPSVEVQAKEFFRTKVNQPPEHEFHRALKKLKIHYQCSFEEGESEGEPETAPRPTP